MEVPFKDLVEGYLPVLEFVSFFCFRIRFHVTLLSFFCDFFYYHDRL